MFVPDIGAESNSTSAYLEGLQSTFANDQQDSFKEGNPEEGVVFRVGSLFIQACQGR
jgi:hypothetical protein